jgi:hypothetical protein
MPALGFSLFMIAIGAILAFAVTTSVSGISISTVGVIFMIVGIIGMVLSLLFWTTFSPFGTTGHRHVVEEDVVDPHIHRPMP